MTLGALALTKKHSHHCSPGLDEPVESELWSVPYTLSKFFINIFFIKAHLVQHANQKPVFLLRTYTQRKVSIF